MKAIQGIWWPDDVGAKWQSAIAHVQAAEWAIDHAPTRRTVVQAGGNVGLWPRRLAASFQRVITFEPSEKALECLRKNVPESVEVHAAALGDQPGTCSLIHKSFGAHRVYFGSSDDIPVTTVDALELDDLDYLQLDVEGYEWHALMGARTTLQRCHPLVQCEFRHHSNTYGQSDETVRALLIHLGYHCVSRQDIDEVFA